ncbi:MAG: glycosyltransferase family 2 protein [Acidimicrobiales bacterium]
MSPEVTVVIPTRDRKRLVLRALRSALAQHGATVQAVVVDDGSVDGTAAAVAAAHPEVRLIRHDQALGSSVARNVGIEAARTPWVAFLDDDDVWAPGKLAAQLAALAQPRVDGGRARWACCSAVLLDAADRLIGWNPVRGGEVDLGGLLIENRVPGGGSSVVADRKLLAAVGGFADIEHSEDWDLWIRLAQEAGNAVAVAQPLVGYRVWMSSSSRIEGLEADWHLVLGRHAELTARMRVPPDQLALHRYRAFRAMHSRHFREAATSMFRVARLQRSPKSAAMALAVRIGGSACFPLWSKLNGGRVPAEVRAETERWMALLTEGPEPSGAGVGPGLSEGAGDRGGETDRGAVVLDVVDSRYKAR